MREVPAAGVNSVSKGIIHATIDVENARTQQRLPLRCLVDTGALHMCEVTLADGGRRKVPYVGPMIVRFANRSCFEGALVLGDEALLGAIPMEDMDLVFHPATRKLSVNPDNPNIATSVVKSTTEVLVHFNIVSPIFFSSSLIGLATRS